MGGDPGAPTTAESTASILEAYQAYLPGLMATIRQEVIPTDQIILQSQQQLSPQAQELNAKLYEQYAPRFAQANLASEKAALLGPGTDLVRAANSLNREIDPEYFKTREAAGNALSNLLGSIDPTGLSTGEAEAVRRAQAQTGGANFEGSSTSSLRNALDFGDRLGQKRDQLSQIINTASGFLPASRQGADAFGQATGRTGTATFGQNFGNANAGQTAFSATGNVLNGVFGLKNQQNEINANRRDAYEKILGSIPNY